jgi:hypothetical protein
LYTAHALPALLIWHAVPTPLLSPVQAGSVALPSLLLSAVNAQLPDEKAQDVLALFSVQFDPTPLLLPTQVAAVKVLPVLEPKFAPAINVLPFDIPPWPGWITTSPPTPLEAC